MRAYRKKIAIAVASAFAVVGTQATAFAQEDDKEEDGGFETIQVTAQKRVERVSDIPVAVSVLNSDQIDSTFQASFEGLQALAPSVSFRKGTTTRNSAVTVRGIGTISFSVAAEPSVSTVVDGVVLGRSGQAFTDLYDLERIEILRGPQGTLFGKNASAGVINITTKRPTGATEGMIEATVFQDNEYRLRGKIQGEISDTAAGSLVFTKSEFDGNLRNVYNNTDVNGYDREGVRAMLDLEVTDDTKMLFIFENMEANDNCCADIEGLPSGRNPASEAAPNSNGVVNGVPDFDLNQRLVDHDFESRTIDKHTGFSVQLDTDFDNFSFTSITAYRTWDNTEFREGDFTSIAGDSDQPVFGVPFQLHDVGPQTWDQFSQELRLASTTDGDFQWQTGFFYWNQQSERSFTRDASCQNNAFDPAVPGSGQLFEAINNHMQSDLGIANPSVDDVNDFIAANNITCNANDIVSATAFMETEFNNWAVFADATYDVTEDFRLLGGIRYTDDEVSFSHNRVSNDVYGRRGVGVRPATLNTDFDGETDETDVSIRVGGQYDIMEDGMVYATYSQGYKGPGFNVFYNMSQNDTRPIGAETSDAYELGFKYATRDVLFNAAIFRTEIEGFQANNFDDSDGTTITRLTNAGDVITEGFEMDFMWQANDNLTITGGLASISAEIDKFNCPPSVAATCSDRSGIAIPFAPELKYSLMADYVQELEDMQIFYNLQYVYTDDQVTNLPRSGINDEPIDPRWIIPDYGLLHASVGFSFRDDQYRVSLIGRNLSDEQFFTTYSGDGFRYQVPREADRYFGVQFRANF